MSVKTLALGTEPATSVAPIVVNLGKTRRSKIKKLKRGTGPLMSDVEDVLAQVRDSLGDTGQNIQLVPVVMVYRKKSRRRRVGLFGV